MHLTEKKIRFPFLILFLLVSFSGAGCASAQYKTGASEYFREDYQCGTGILEQEKNLKYLAVHSHYRTSAFKEAPSSPDIMIAGDSIAALFLPHFAEKYLPGLRMMNRGIPGDTTYLFLARLEQDVLVHRPSVLMISIGGNDLILGRCFSEIQNNIRLIITAVRRKLPDTRILLVSVPPVNVKELNAVSPFLNQKSASLVQDFPNVYFFDLWASLSEENRPFLKKEYRIIRSDGKTDAVHFNEEGYRIWSEMLLKSDHYQFITKNKQ